MPDGVDVHSLLNNGFWSSTRTQSPEPSFAAAPPTPSYSYNPRVVPRTSYSALASQDAYYTRRTVREFPPAPTVEDEEESLAKEHGSVVSDDKPPHRGETDQYPILQLVHDHNPERRFVIVPGSSDAGSSSDDTTDSERESRRWPVEKEQQSPQEEQRSSEKGQRSPEKEPRSLEKEPRTPRKEPRSPGKEQRRAEKKEQRRAEKEQRSPEKEHRSPEKEHRSPEKEQRRAEKKEQRRAEKREQRSAEKEEERGRRTEARPLSYEANTRRKYDSLAPEDAHASRKSERDDQDKTPNRERRRSRLGDLPAIVTDLDDGKRSDERSEKRSEGTPRDTPRDTPRTKSAVRGERGPDDYFSLRLGPRKIPDESMLTPDIIKHSTKGRDRAYWDYSGSSTPSAADRPSPVDRPSAVDRHKSDPHEDSRSVPARRRGDQVSPIMIKRHSAIDVPKLDRRKSRGAYDDDRTYLQLSPPKLDRKHSSQSYTLGEREPLRAPSRMKSRNFRDVRESPRDERYLLAYPEDEYAREDERRRSERRHRRKSTVHDDRNGYLLTPSEARSAVGRVSKASSPLASPLACLSDFSYGGAGDPMPSPSSRSSTFPSGRELKKYDATYATDEPAPERPLSRASTARSGVGLKSSLTSLAAVSALSRPASPSERVRKASAIPAKVQSGSDSRNTSRTGSPSPSSVSSKTGAASDQLVSTYRRYSQEVRRGELPDRPDCPRTKEEAGHMDWLTLPRCNNFNICPSCYQAAFANTEFKHRFIPAPMRPHDRPLKCDFGSSEWYHIAWLLTHKSNQPDLRLFHGIANASATGQPCTGPREDYRIWHTIKDPVTQRPVRSFNVCHNCAKTVEAMLPNLYGVFVPIDSPAEPTRGVCDMHQEGYGGIRKRFMLYFDAMETVSDRALATNSAPDVRLLADKVRAIAQRSECSYGRSELNQRWYTMRSIPKFTVCEECFDEVVWPEIEREDAGVQGDFAHKPTTLPLASCQLYSPRMRSAFQKAVRRQDLRYFDSKVADRQAKEREIVARMTGLDKRILGAEWCAEESRRLQKEWAKWE